MADSLIEAFNKMSEAMTDFYIRMTLGHTGIARIWEQKMDLEVFEFQMDNRRDLRRKKPMALIRMIGGILTFLFWLFVLAGVLVVGALIIASPVVAAFALACILAGVLNAWHRYTRRQG
jgi:fatty acid desaturase